MNPVDVRTLQVRCPGWAQIGAELKLDCPKCGDHTRNLQVHTERGIFHCWRCHYKGHVTKLFALLGVPFVGGEPVRATSLRRTAPRETPGDGTPIPYKAFGSCNRDVWPMYGHVAYDLAFEKLGGRAVPTQWGWGIGPLRTRLVIPVTHEGAPVTFQARALYSWQRSKYVSGKRPHFRPTSQCFYKVGGEAKRVCLVEGPFDTIPAHDLLGIPVWGCFGTNLSTWQRNHLARCAEEVVIWMDPDFAGGAAASTMGTALQAMGLEVTVAESATDPKGATAAPTERPPF